jgi:hypothetical protein
VNLLRRLSLASSLISLTLIVLIGAVIGTWTTWDTRTTYERVAFVAVCVVMSLGLAISVSLLFRGYDQFPWGRVLLAIGSIALSWGLLAMANAVVESSVRH